MYPSNQDYKIALMIGSDSFRTLEKLEVIPNPNHPSEPWFATGGLAIVFKVKYQDKLYALKCFTKEVPEREERLYEISKYLKENPSDYFVDFNYYENEIWVDNEEGGQGYPVVLMEWVEGLTLDNYLKEKCAKEDKQALKELYDTFGHMVLWLQAQPIAHGDLKHDNIIVQPNGQLKLIDYDGMYIPVFIGQKASEIGSPCYQHPKRTADYFNEHLDDFSLLILQTTLLAFETETSLFASNFNGDGLLFKDSDFLDFNAKLLKNTIWVLPNILLPILATNIQKQLTSLEAFDFAPYFVHLQHSKLDRTWIENFALNYKHQFRFLISTKYSLSEKIIEKYQKYKSHKTYEWSWYGLELNSKISWSVEFIEKYKDKLDWRGIRSMGIYGLSLNPNLPWSELFIEKYKDKWDWGEFGLSNNPNLPWSEEFVEKYKDKWSWKGLSGNKSLPWSRNFIEKYEDKWQWDYKGLSSNRSLPWEIYLIEKFEHKWTWGMYGLSQNENLPWSIYFLEKFDKKLNWGKYGLSWNKRFDWSIDFIEKYHEKWDWHGLSQNSKLPWSIDFIEKYYEKWNWGEHRLSGNPNLPWSELFIEKYIDKWNWKGLSNNKSLPWSELFIEKYKDKWDWGEFGLSNNPNLPWSEEFIDRYKDKWDYKRLFKNQTFIQFILSKLNDDVLEEIMIEITK